MAKMAFGRLEIDPRTNPAVLDTATWDPEGAWRRIRSIGPAYWATLAKSALSTGALPVAQGFTPFRGSCAADGAGFTMLAELADYQCVFIRIGKGEAETVMGEPFDNPLTVPGGIHDGPAVAMYKADDAVIDRFVRLLHGGKRPRAMGGVPRLGIGTRMSTSHWPGIWRAMQRGGFAANAIQNSLRELNLLKELTAGLPPKENYQFSFGSIQEGHTGSTFEGLWTYGVLDALKSDTFPRYGADADHIMVKRGTAGLERARQIIEAARYYSFYTLDVSDLLDYEALSASPPAGSDEYFAREVEQEGRRREIAEYHARPKRIAGVDYHFDRESIGFLAGKHWKALHALEVLHSDIQGLKNGEAVDIELSIDENPPEIETFNCLTTEAELVFLLEEVKRRELSITHVAPNFGVEKGVDYRCPDGLAGLETRTRRLFQIAGHYGAFLDCHSGDDLQRETRRTFCRATGGQIHFKISPSLQVLFGEVLADLAPESFQFWWDDALAYAGREARAGSAFAAQALKQYERATDPAPSARHAVFHHFNFATVGRRGQDGQFLNRHRFYTLPGQVYSEYERRLADHLCLVAQDVLNP